MTRPLQVIVQGNCQAGQLAHAVRWAANRAGVDASIHFLENWNVSGQLYASLDERTKDAVGGCDVFIVQVDQGGTPSVSGGIPPSARTKAR